MRVPAPVRGRVGRPRWSARGEMDQRGFDAQQQPHRARQVVARRRNRRAGWLIVGCRPAGRTRSFSSSTASSIRATVSRTSLTSPGSCSLTDCRPICPSSRAHNSHPSSTSMRRRSASLRAAASPSRSACAIALRSRKRCSATRMRAARSGGGVPSSNAWAAPSTEWPSA